MTKFEGFNKTEQFLFCPRLPKDNYYDKPETLINGSHRCQFAKEENLVELSCIEFFHQIVIIAYLYFWLFLIILLDGQEMPIRIEMLLVWGSNFKHNKRSIHSSDLQLLIQLHNLIVHCLEKNELTQAIADFMVLLTCYNLLAQVLQILAWYFFKQASTLEDLAQ